MKSMSTTSASKAIVTNFDRLPFIDCLIFAHSFLFSFKVSASFGFPAIKYDGKSILDSFGGAKFSAVDGKLPPDYLSTLIAIEGDHVVKRIAFL